MDKLFFVQDKTKALKHLTLLLETGILSASRVEASSMVLDHIANMEQDWYERAEQLIQNGNVEHARGIFLHELGKTLQEFEAFKRACEQTTLLPNSPGEVARVIEQEAMSPLLDERKISATPIVHKPTAIKNKKSKSKKSVKVEEKSVVITRLLKDFTYENLDALFSLPNGVSALSDFVLEDNDTCERCLLERIFNMASRLHVFCNYLIQSERSDASVSLIDRIEHQLIFPNGFTALHIAAHCDAAEFIDIFSAKGKDVQRPNKSGEMPLYLAITQGRKKAEEAFIRAGADYSKLLFQGLIVKNGKPSIPLFVAIDYGADDLIPATLSTLGDESQELIFCNNAPSILGASALFNAAQSGDLLAVRTLIERDDEDVNQVVGPRAVTPLLIAVQHGHFEVVQALLYGKVNVNQQAADGTTALLIAAQFGYIEIASFLISTAEADVNLAGQFGCTPLMVAANRKDVDMVNLLIHCGANINQAMTNQRTAYHLALIHGGELLNLFKLEHVRLSLSMELMSSFTHAAVVKFFFDLSKVHYLTRKIEISGEYSSLFVHILKNPSYVSILCKVLETGEMGCLLFNRVANQLKFEDANTALHLAAELNCEQFINTWSIYAFDLNKNNKFGFKPIQLAIRHGQSAAVKALIRAGADLDVEWNGLSLLHIAVDSNRDMSHFGVICHLLNSGADINESLLIDKGETVLYIAAREGNASIVKLFLSKKANVNQACLDGMTPLMIACAKGYLDIVNQLLDAKADMMLKNEEGQDCFSLASRHPCVQTAISSQMQRDVLQPLYGNRISSFFTHPDSTLPPHDNLHQHERPHL